MVFATFGVGMVISTAKGNGILLLLRGPAVQALAGQPAAGSQKIIQNRGGVFFGPDQKKH